ncbi:putative ribonuclease H-like domain-containing protein [Tanacetum coccineum]
MAFIQGSSSSSSSDSETSKDIVEKPKTVRPSAPIIEDWDTDSDNDMDHYMLKRFDYVASTRQPDSRSGIFDSGCIRSIMTGKQGLPYRIILEVDVGYVDFAGSPKEDLKLEGKANTKLFFVRTILRSFISQPDHNVVYGLHLGRICKGVSKTTRLLPCCHDDSSSYAGNPTNKNAGLKDNVECQYLLNKYHSATLLFDGEKKWSREKGGASNKDKGQICARFDRAALDRECLFFKRRALLNSSTNEIDYIHMDHPKVPVQWRHKFSYSNKEDMNKKSFIDRTCMVVTSKRQEENNIKDIPTLDRPRYKRSSLQFKLQKVWTCGSSLKARGILELSGFPNKVYKVEKALYGLHQAPRACGYRRGTIDKTLFIKKDKGDILLVKVYVDDIIFGSTKKSLCVKFEQMMHKRFQMSSMGELTFLLGLQVQQKEDGIFISQDKYVADILKKFDFTTLKATSTLIETNKALNKDEEAKDVDVHLYRSMIGSLMYLTAYRPDIMFAVCACARF